VVDHFENSEEEDADRGHRLLSLGKPGESSWLLEAEVCHGGHESYWCILGKKAEGCGHMGEFLRLFW
jgi:hypothetical protein